jgi:hypothetical protein
MGGTGIMICRHCKEEVIVNPVRNSPEPFVYHPYKHKFGNLIHCFDSKANMLGSKAEPEGAKQ